MRLDFCCIVLFLCVSCCRAYNVLFVHTPVAGGRVGVFQELIANLASHGNNVTVLISALLANFHRPPDGVHFEVVPFPADEQADFLQIFGNAMHQQWENPDYFFYGEYYLRFVQNQCRALLTDKERLERFRNVKFDVAVVDEFYGHCAAAYVHFQLNVPFIYAQSCLLNSVDAWHLNVPSPLSYVPSVYVHLVTKLTDNMTFGQRIQNLGRFVLDWYYYYRW